MQNARTITLSSVFIELSPFLTFAILNLSGAYLWKYKRKSNETWYIERRPSEIVQSAKTVTLLQVIIELIPLLIFAEISFPVAYLLKYFTLSLI